VVLTLFFYFHNRESTDDAQVDGHITPIASKIYGRVAKVLVDDNQPVKAGQIIVQIDDADYRAALDQAKAALALAEDEARSAGVDVPRTSESVASGTSSAEAQLSGAQADLMRAQAAYDQAQTADLAVAQANIERSKANAQLAKADLERYTPLMEKGEISKQQYDAAKANADASASALVADEQRLSQAKRNVDITRAQLDAARARIDGAKAAVSSAHADQKRVAMRSADAQAKLASVDRARASLQAAQLNLSYCNVVAPVDGVATHKSVEPGQIVQAGQGLLVVVPLQNVWITANFKETQLRNMKPGQKAYIKSDTYGKTFTGHVDSIAGATGAVLSLLPPENATGNYVKVVQRIPVKIILDPISPDVAVLRPGMNVDATVVTN
jgi:membrane fusion protein (multidrug efflux system)